MSPIAYAHPLSAVLPEIRRPRAGRVFASEATVRADAGAPHAREPPAAARQWQVCAGTRAMCRSMIARECKIEVPAASRKMRGSAPAGEADRDGTVYARGRGAEPAAVMRQRRAAGIARQQRRAEEVKCSAAEAYKMRCISREVRHAQCRGMQPQFVTQIAVR